MFQKLLNKSRRQHPTRHQLYGHLPTITKTIQVKRTRHAGHCWRSRDELISDVLLWTPTYGRAKAGQPAWTYILQLYDDTGYSPEDLPEAMNDREKWRERVRDIHASGTTWWWWWWWWHIVSKLMIQVKLINEDIANTCAYIINILFYEQLITSTDNSLLNRNIMLHIDLWTSRQSGFFCTGRTCENKQKQSRGWTEIWLYYEMIYADAHVRHGQLQSWVSLSSQRSFESADIEPWREPVE